MKFWVKAIVDEAIQEQLFVTATSTEELRLELETLLDIPISTISIQDFQSQVVDRINEGEEIVTVKIKKQKAVSRKGSASASELLNMSRSSDGKPTPPSNLYLSLGSTVQSLSGGPTLSAKPKDGNGGSRRRLSASGGIALTLPTSAPLLDPLRSVEPQDSHDRLNTSMESGQLTARGPGMPGSNANSPPETELQASHSTSPSKAPQLMDFPPVAKLWLSRERVELLLTRQFRGKYKPVLCGCFVRTKDRDGYSFFQIASVEKGPQGKIVLDTVYGTDAIVADTISNAAPSSDEVRKWVKKMLNSTKPFPTHGFVEAKLGDVESALSSALSILTASPVLPVPSAASQTSPEVTSTFDALTMESPPPPSPELSDGEEHIPGARVRRPTVLRQLARTAVSCGKLTVKVNDALEFTSVCARETCNEEEPLVSRDASTSESVNTLAIYGTRHSNIKARRARRPDYAGFEMVLDTAGATAATASTEALLTTSTGGGLPRQTLALQVLGAGDPPTLAGCSVLHDRDTTEKGYALFGAPVKWQGRFWCLGQRRPLSETSSCSPYVRKDGTDDDQPADEEEDSVSEVTPRGGAGTAVSNQQLVQDFVVFNGTTPGRLSRELEPTSLPIPQWASFDGREVVVLRPTLVEHLGALHCFYLVRLDNSSAQDTRSQTTSTGNRRHHHRHQSASSYQQLHARLNRRPSGRGLITETSQTLPSVMDPEDAMYSPALEDRLLGGSISEPPTATAAGDLTATPPNAENSNNVSGGSPSESAQPSTPPPPPPPYCFGLVHAMVMCEAELSDGGVPRSGGDLAGPGSLVVSPTTQRPALRWRLVNTSGPLAESAGDVEPLFAVVSAPPEELNSMMTLTRANSRPLLRAPVDVSPPELFMPNATRRELNVLWHSRELARLPQGFTTPRQNMSVTGLFGGRSSLRLSGLKPHDGAGRSFTLSPAVSRRRSPAVASLQPEHSLGGRAEIPFRRITNSDDTVSAAAWTEDAYFAAVEVEGDKLTEDVESVSLFTKENRVFMATVTCSGGRLSVWTIPVTGEP